MKCKKCGRKLKSEQAIKIGYGPVCAKQLNIKISTTKNKYRGEDLLKWTKK